VKIEDVVTWQDVVERYLKLTGSEQDSLGGDSAMMDISTSRDTPQSNGDVAHIENEAE
jgi:hypothetical protein